MKRLLNAISYPPNWVFALSAMFLLFAIAFTILLSLIYGIIHEVLIAMPAELDEQPLMPEDMDLRLLLLLVGRPWIAFIVGLTVGLIAIAYENRITLRNRNQIVSARVKRILKQGPRFSRPDLRTIWPFFTALLSLLGAGYVFGFSFIIAGLASVVSVFLRYPSERELFEATLSSLSDESMDESNRQRATNWLRITRISTAGAVVVTMGFAVFFIVAAVTNYEMKLEMDEFVAEIRERAEEYRNLPSAAETTETP